MKPSETTSSETKITRRDMVRSMSGLALGAGLASLPLNRILAADAAEGSRWQPAVKVSPPGPKSLALLEEVRRYVARSNYTGLYGIALKEGQGVHVRDLDDNVYLDCLTAASSAVLGYSRHEIADAYHQSALRIQQTCFPYAPNPDGIELARRITAITPGDFPKKCIMGLSGSDANDGAIEAARKFTGKMGIISFDFAYHGSTGLSQAASGFRALNEGVYDLGDRNFVRVPFPVTPAQADRVLRDVETILAFGQTAAMLVEIIQGDSGALVAVEGFFPRLARLLAEHKVLLIDDEVQAGMGRTGRWFACEHEGIVPDLVVMAKGLSAGYAPVSCVVGRADVLEALVPAGNVFTYTGHGPSAAAAAKVIDIITDEHLIENARVVGARLLDGLCEAGRKFPDIIVEARGRGVMLGLEIDIARDPLASKIFAFRALEKGVYFGYIGDKQRAIRILPPLILTAAEADIITRVVHETAGEMHAGRVPQATIDKVRRFAVGW